MRRILYFLIMCLSLSLVSAKDQIVNNKRQVQSYFSSGEKSFNKKYYQLMTMLVSPLTTDKQVVKIQRKLIKLFNSYEYSRFYKVRECVHYQLGHFCAFGCFDPYYADGVPSDINRETNIPFDKQSALERLNSCPNAFGRLLLIPNTWLTDYERGLGLLFYNDDVELSDEVMSYFLSLPDFHPNFFKSGTYMKEPGSDKKNPVPSFKGTMFLMKLLCYLPADHPCKSQLLPKMSKEDLVSLALIMQKEGKVYEAMYYGFLAAFRGDVNGLLVGIDAFEGMGGEDFKKRKANQYEEGAFFELMEEYMKFYANDSGELKPYHEVFDKLASHYKKVSDDMFSVISDRRFAELADRVAAKERRKQQWRNVLVNALGQTAAQMGNSSAMAQYSNQNMSLYTPQLNGMGVSGLNAMIDPRYAMQQVNNQYYNEYQLFNTYNKKPDGSSYTFDEYMALNAQALNKLKSEGVDLVAEQRELNEKNREEFKKEIEEERNKRVKKMAGKSDGGANETPVAKSNSDESTGGSTAGGSTVGGSGQTGGSSTGGSSNSGVEKGPKKDAKQQFETDPVSSSDYKKLKTVTVYYRDGDKARAVFHNVGLYRKGINEYIKLDNTFYPRLSSNWSRFEHAIDFAGKQYYYND